MKSLLCIFFIINVLAGNAQDSGIVTYKKEWKNLYSESESGKQDKVSNPQKYREYRELEKLQKELTKQLAYKLKFDKDRSFFYLEDLLSIENQSDLALAKGPFQGDYYYDRKADSVIWAIEALGEKFLVNLDKIDWKLEKKQKMISGYSCFKASAKIPLDNGEFENVNAWYAPEIPLSYGPLQYNGLPGLVVRFETGSERYTLAQIKQKEIKFNFPKKRNFY
ncbi:GLPGLI family protein [Zunongwangia endophytica]|uniref:GLPGLI family protein n=1 Tax=Zunongwangia endophytica TaxID=1808945 RepID=A0ABV8H7G2_9FLAO|nr:GLPGLI family protein [Zunongwangia endophytica]MDN3595794.1 GLPGLI family protein [Zunongwangia endophytica]